MLFQHTSWSRCFLSVPFLSELGPHWPQLRITASPLPLPGGSQLCLDCCLAKAAPQFASSRAGGIARDVACVASAHFTFSVTNLKPCAGCALKPYLDPYSGSFRLSWIILLLVLALKHGVSVCPPSSGVALPGLSCSNSLEFIHLCETSVG